MNNLVEILWSLLYRSVELYKAIKEYAGLMIPEVKKDSSK